MRVTVRLFARLRDLAGGADWPCEAPDGASVADIWRLMTSAHPALEPFGRGISCAVNAEFARTHSQVHDGDEVAFLPPVSGGSR
jgi:molybdopterin converting factor subunit 1